jgi:hypothetical protein
MHTPSVLPDFRSTLLDQPTYAGTNLKPSIRSLPGDFVRSKRPVYPPVDTKSEILDDSDIKTQATNGRGEPCVTVVRTTLVEAQRRLTVLDAARHDIDRSETEGENRADGRMNATPNGEYDTSQDDLWPTVVWIIASRADRVKR